MENKIRIENPCSEKWNAMPSNNKGRFCDSCHKTVVDFTRMDNPEIRKYFVEHSDTESICGYYKSTQVENDSRYSNLRNRFDRIKVKPIKMVALFSLSFLFTFSSCIMGKRAEEQSEDVVENDTINKNVNDTLQKVEKDSLAGKVDELKEKK